MELRLIVLSVAVFSCLVPPALSFGAVAAKAAAVTAAKGAAAIGAGLLAKKAVVGKGALFGAGLLAKKAVIAKGAVLGGALLAKKALVVKGVLAAKKAMVVKGALAAKTAAVGIAAHGAAVLAAKKAAIKATALGILATKAAAVQGAIGVAAKGAAVGGSILSTKAAALNSVATAPVPFAIPQPVAYSSLIPMEVPVAAPYVAETFVPGPQAVMSRLSGLWGTLQNSMAAKSVAVGDLVGPVGATAVVDAAPSYYEVAAPARIYSVPVVGRVDDCN